jgi:hypothetical protein
MKIFWPELGRSGRHILFYYCYREFQMIFGDMLFLLWIFFYTEKVVTAPAPVLFTWLGPISLLDVTKMNFTMPNISEQLLQWQWVTTWENSSWRRELKIFPKFGAVQWCTLLKSEQDLCTLFLAIHV